MSRIMQASFDLKYDGPALKDSRMDVKDLAPAMLSVGQAFEALNSLYNGKSAKVGVNVRAYNPGCFHIVFEVFQEIKPITDFLAGNEVTGSLNLLEILFGSGGVSTGLVWLIKKLQGRKPDRVEKISPDMFRIYTGDQTFDVPLKLLEAYRDFSVRKSLEGFIAQPLSKGGINEVSISRNNKQIEHISYSESALFEAPEMDEDVLIDDTRRAAYTIRDLSFDEDGCWKLFDGQNPIKASIQDEHFINKVSNNEIRFAKDDVLVCLVHFIQRRTKKGVKNEYTVKEVIEHIPAPRTLRLPGMA